MRTTDWGMEAPALTPGSAIDALGGTGAVAQALSLADPTVSSWRERGIPPGRCLALSKLAAERGRNEITLEALLEFATQPPDPTEARA